MSKLLKAVYTGIIYTKWDTSKPVAPTPKLQTLVAKLFDGGRGRGRGGQSLKQTGRGRQAGEDGQAQTDLHG